MLKSSASPALWCERLACDVSRYPLTTRMGRPPKTSLTRAISRISRRSILRLLPVRQEASTRRICCSARGSSVSPGPST